MKRNTKSNAAPATAACLSLVVFVSLISGGMAWALAGILGLAALGLSTTLPKPKLALVRNRSQKRHFQALSRKLTL